MVVEELVMILNNPRFRNYKVYAGSVVNLIEGQASKTAENTTLHIFEDERAIVIASNGEIVHLYKNEVDEPSRKDTQFR